MCPRCDELSDTRKARLGEFGFEFSQRKKYKLVSWDERFEELLAFRQEHGHTNVSVRPTKLGSWVSVQQRNFQCDKLSESRKARLEEVGFEFSLLTKLNTEFWDERFEELRAFWQEHGHTWLPN